MNIKVQSLAEDLAFDALKEEILNGPEAEITYWDQAFEKVDGQERLKPKFQKMYNEYAEEYLKKILQHRIYS